MSVSFEHFTFWKILQNNCSTHLKKLRQHCLEIRRRSNLILSCGFTGANEKKSFVFFTVRIHVLLRRAPVHNWGEGGGRRGEEEGKEGALTQRRGEGVLGITASMADWRVGGGYSGEKKVFLFISFFGAAAGRDFDLQCTWNYDCGRRGKVYAFEIKAATYYAPFYRWGGGIFPSTLPFYCGKQ